MAVDPNGVGFVAGARGDDGADDAVFIALEAGDTQDAVEMGGFGLDAPIAVDAALHVDFEFVVTEVTAAGFGDSGMRLETGFDFCRHGEALVAREHGHGLAGDIVEFADAAGGIGGFDDEGAAAALGAHQPCIKRHGGTARAADGFDDGGGAGDKITRGEQAGYRCHVGVRVYLQPAFVEHIRRGDVLDARVIRELAGGEEDQISGDLELAVRYNNWAAAAGGIGLAELGAYKARRADTAVAEESDWGNAFNQLDAFAAGFDDFFMSDGHFAFGAAVVNADLLRAEAQA